MKTLIVGDIHLCTEKNAEDTFLCDWLSDILYKVDPEHIVFNGDTFEISFCTGSRDTLSKAEDILDRILNLHHPFFIPLKERQNLKKITFLTGEHDYLIMRTLNNQLKSFFSDKDIIIGEYFYDENSKLLAMHGHQFDYNCIPSYNIEEALTDRLTRVFETFIFQDEEKTEIILEGFKQQEFSFWYAAGNLPNYISATQKIFGHNPDIYFRGLSTLLKSDFFASWVDNLNNPFNKLVGKLAKQTSCLPHSFLKRLNKSWWFFSQKIVLARHLSLLKKGVDPTLLDVPEHFSVNCLVVSHAHKNGKVEFTHDTINKRCYNAVSPRWYVMGMKEGYLELHRDVGFVVINSNGHISYDTSRQSKNCRLYPRLLYRTKSDLKLWS